MKLKGDCNRCGLCCFVQHPETKEMLHCNFLSVQAEPGKPLATQCTVHADREPGMHIYLLDSKNRIAGESICAIGTDEEVDNIIERGIGKGCSMEVIQDG